MGCTASRLPRTVQIQTRSNSSIEATLCQIQGPFSEPAMGQEPSTERDPELGLEPGVEQLSLEEQVPVIEQQPVEQQMPVIDSVEELFADLGGPHGRNINDSMDDNTRIHCVLEEFLEGPVSQDPDYQYLVQHARKSLVERSYSSAYFRQQLAHLAVQKTFSRKDNSFKARQLKYHKWLAHGCKHESYPFPNKDPKGLPSTTRIGTLVSPKVCAACGKQGANMRCPDCSLHDEAHILEKTAYCNKKCLQDHYKTHQRTCECRRMIYHAAILLDHMFRRMHEATYAYRLATAYQKNGLLYLVDENLDRAGITGRHIFISPPKNLANSEEMYLGLLMWAQSDEVKLSASSLIECMLQPVCKDIKLVDFQARNVLTPLCQMSADGKVSNLNFHIHTVLKLTLKSDEKYALDLTAAQFGWKETLAPWGAWSGLRAYISSTEPFRTGCQKAKEFFAPDLTGVDRVQEAARANLIKEVVKELRGFRDLDSRLKADGEDFQQTRLMFKRMMEAKILFTIKNEYHKDEYRLYLTGAPNYGVRPAKDLIDVLKEAWISTKEYDKLKERGTDMRKWWRDRVDGKFKEELNASGLI